MPSKVVVTLYPLSDQYIQLSGVYILGVDSFGNLTVKNYSSTATVTATLYDVNQAPVPGLTNLAMTYVAASQGIYRGLAAGSGFNPPVGAYMLVITVVIGSSQLVFTLVANVVPLLGN